MPTKRKRGASTGKNTKRITSNRAAKAGGSVVKSGAKVVKSGTRIVKRAVRKLTGSRSSK
jgi:hypothetical protein